MNNPENLESTLQSIGKACFVRWFEYCMNGDSVNHIVQKIRSDHEYGYTAGSYKGRVQNIRRIINKGLLYEALQLISQSNRVEEDARYQAYKYLENCAQSLPLPKGFDPETKGYNKKSITKVRVGHASFKSALFDYWGGCSVTGIKTSCLLTASHIKPWKDSSENEKVSVYNGLLLIPNLDKLFDRGLISFDDQGSLLKSKSEVVDWQTLGVADGLSLRLPMTDKMIYFMQWHREYIYRV